MSSAVPGVDELLARGRRGDRQALEELFALCRNYLSILAQAQVGSWLRVKVDASDLVQQTLLEAYRDFARFDGQTQGEWFAWLRCVLERNTADFVRRYRGTAMRDAGREVPLAGLDSSAPGAAEPAARGESPSDQLMRAERWLRVADAVAQLDADYREVLLLRNLQQLDFAEVARRMNRSRPAVQMLWMRAVRKLQELVPAE